MCRKELRRLEPASLSRVARRRDLEGPPMRTPALLVTDRRALPGSIPDKPIAASAPCHAGWCKRLTEILERLAAYCAAINQDATACAEFLSGSTFRPLGLLLTYASLATSR